MCSNFIPLEQREQFQETFAKLHTLSGYEKNQFLEELLFNFTIAAAEYGQTTNYLSLKRLKHSNG